MGESQLIIDDENIVNLVKTCWEDIDKARAILKEKPHLVHARSTLDESALSLLIRWYSRERYSIETHLKAVEMLIDFGFDVNINCCGSSPIYNAIGVGNQLEVVKLLLENGVNINPTYKGFMGESTLGAAVYNKNIEQVEFLLQNGADVNLKDDFGNSPLHYSVESDEKIEITKLLLSYEADINIQDMFDNTPLHEASTEENAIETMKLLLDRGADTDIRNHSKETPLESAERLKMHKNAQVIIEHWCKEADKKE